MFAKKIIGTICLILAAVYAQAQGCSVCTKTAAELGEDAGNSLNMGIIYLAFLPLSIILFLLFKWYRSYKHTI